MQGLRALYGATARNAEWARLVDEIIPSFVNPASDDPLPGREEEWSVVTEYRVGLAMDARRWPEAERLQSKRVAWNRERAAAALALEQLNSFQRNAIRSLVASLQLLGRIQLEQAQPACAESLKEAFDLAQRIGNQYAAAACANSLGGAYLYMSTLRNFDEAERWYRRDLELTPESDHVGRAKSHGQLGAVADERFDDARKENRRAATLLGFLNTALHEYHQALRMLPDNAITDLAIMHNQLGIIYRNAGETDQSLHHYRESIRYQEIVGDTYVAAQIRSNVAVVLASVGRFSDALQYAHAALRDFQSFGDRAQDKIEQTLRLIADTERDLAQQKSQSAPA
jgi:tetratricopeptide (TPR) repeat protein